MFKRYFAVLCMILVLSTMLTACASSDQSDNTSAPVATNGGVVDDVENGANDLKNDVENGANDLKNDVVDGATASPDANR